MEDCTELEAVIRSLLVSNPKVMKMTRLESDFYETEGRRFPYRNLGFKSFQDYLRSIPHVVQLVPYNSSNPDVLPIVTEAISHIDKLVSKQRNTVPNRKRTSRGGGGSFRNTRPSGFPPPRRRPLPNCHPPQPRPPPNKGTYVSDIENHLKNKYSREDLYNNGIYSTNDLLPHANDLVEQVGDKLYPNLSNYPEITSTQKQQPETYLSNAIPAGMEDKSENESDYDDNEINSDHYNDIYNMKYDEAFDNIEEEVVSNYTIQRCTESLLNSKTDTELAYGGAEQADFAEDSDFPECNISDKMISNFRTILAKYPDGIWATQLPKIYFEEFKVPLDLQSLGHTSAVEMASFLPHVFFYERSGSHDWKLFDARKHSALDKLLPDDIHEKGKFENYVPKSILENIRQLLERRPEGIRSRDLLYYYEMEFHKKLDLETLGFKTLEDFLELLKQIITVRKATGHYLLLPKHKQVSLDMIKQHEYEELKINVDPCEFLGPENVLKPNDVIPPQELPALNFNNPLEPLLAMEVRLGEVISPSLFYLMLDENYLELQSMMDDLHKFYEQEESNYHILLPYLTVNLYCVCKYEGLWHRVMVTGFRKNDTVEVEYIDYGTPGKVKSSELRFLQNDFAKLPAQAICAKLIGLVPKTEDGKWSIKCRQEFLRILSDKRLLAYVYRIEQKRKKEDRIQLEVVLYDTNGKTDVVCNEYLVEKGYAEFITTHQAKKNEETLTVPKASPASSQCPPMVKLEEDIFMNQNFTSTNNRHSPLIQTSNVKRASRVPPGFEDNISTRQGQYQDTWYLGNQLNYSRPPVVHQNFNFNVLFPLRNPLPVPQLLDGTPLQYQQSSQFDNKWTTVFPQSSHCIPFSYPSQIQNLRFPSQSQNYYQSQPYVNISEMNRNLISSTQNACGIDMNVDHGLNKIPGYSSDLSMPLTSAPPPPILQERVQQNVFPDTTPILVEVGEGETNIPNFRTTPPIPELLPFRTTPPIPELIPFRTTPPIPQLLPNTFSSVEAKYAEPQQLKLDDSVISQLKDKDNLKSFEEVFDMKIDRSYINNNDSIEQSQKLTGPQVNNLLREDFPNAIEPSESAAITQLNKTIQTLTLTNNNVESADKNNENWYDIEPDDTPAKSDYYSQNFKTLVEDTSKDLSNSNSNKQPLINLNSKTNKIKENFIQLNSKQDKINWKDIFDPDSISTSERNNTLNKINMNLAKDNLEMKLIKKLEMKDKFFHIVHVNDKPAVISQEFFPQFVKNIKWQVINKIVENKYKPFVIVTKKDNPALFIELERIDLCGGINKKLLLKIGKTSISYISDIAQVFSVLNENPDPDLLAKLEDIELLSIAK